jgi:hypothetical protein
MDAGTKKTAVGNGIIAAGLIAATATFSLLNNNEQPPVAQPVSEQVIIERVTKEARRALAEDKKTLVATPDKVHADVMLWLNDYDKKATAANAVQDERVNKLAAVAETLTTKLTEENVSDGPNQDKLIATLEALANKVTSMDSEMNTLSNRMSFKDAEMTNDLTRVFEGFDKRFKTFETAPYRTATRPSPNVGAGLRFASDEVIAAPSPEAVEANARLARIEELLSTNLSSDKPKPKADAEGIVVDWGDNKPKARTVEPAPTAAQPEPKPDSKGLVRSLAGQTGETINGGADVAVETVNKATGTTGRLVKDVTGTATRLIGGASDTAGHAIGGTADIAKKQGKKAWSKFW